MTPLEVPLEIRNLPPGMAITNKVDRQVDVRLERGLRALAAQGMRTEDMKKMDFGRVRAGQRDDNLKIMELTAEARSVLPPIAMISAMRKLTS